MVLLSLSLLACGFHLRGSLSSSSQAKVYLHASGVESDLKQDLQQYLLSQNRLVESTEQSQIQLLLKSDQWQKRIVSLDENGVASEYSLQYQLIYDLITAEKRLFNQSLKLQEDYAFDSAQLLSVDAQERETKTLIKKQVAQRLLRLLDI